MKRYGLYITLFAMLTACSDYQQEFELSDDLSDYIVTGSIISLDTSARLADKNNQTIFQSGDPVFIGWKNNGGGTSYQYIYSGENGIFHPAEGSANYSLWKDLITNPVSPTEIYAWYGGISRNALPTVGHDITVPLNQTSESVYLSAICMGAHTSVALPAACKSLNFEFNHLLACLKVHVRIDDKAVTPTDVIGSSAVIIGLKTTGKIALEAMTSDYTLSTGDVTTGDIQMYQCPWSDQDPFLIDFKCLVPPQTLPAGLQIVVTLANGKKYICSLDDSKTKLEAGKETYLNIEIAAKEGVSVFTPVCTMFPVVGGAFSGNRIFCTEKVGEKTGFRIYDKRPDGSWGTGEPVYTDENGADVFLASGGGALNIYGDYAVTSFDGTTHFIKKSKTTGKWFYARGKFPFSGYATAISQNFLVTGNHVSIQSGTYIYPIDEKGNLGEGYTDTNISGYKMSLVDNILATNSGVYQYNESTQKWNVLHFWGIKSTKRISTDGKRIIVQDGSGKSKVRIFRVDAGNKKIIEESWDGSPAEAGVDVPIGIYGDYALSGGEYSNSGRDWLEISYRNPQTGNWKNLGSFLSLMKRADPTITATSLKGNHISLKGTRALITSDGVVYFVENIDKMVEDWIANLPSN